MRYFMVGLILLVLLLGAATLAFAQTEVSWTYLCDPLHSGRAPSDLDLPLVLQWRLAAGGTGAAVSTPALDATRVYFVAPKPPETPTAPPGMMPGAPPMPGMGMPGMPEMPGAPGMPGMPGAYGPTAPSAPTTSMLYAADRRTGAQLWKLDTGVQVTSGLTACSNVVYFGASDGRLWAVDAASGDRKWRFEAQKAIKGAPLLLEGVMYFGSDDGRVYAFDLNRNQLVWQFQTGGPVQGTPVVLRDVVYAASQDQYLYALRRTEGSAIWRQPVGSGEIYGSPMIHRDKVLLAAGNRLSAMSARGGERRWVFSAGDLIIGTPAAIDRRIFVGSRDGVMYCLDDATGRAEWRYPVAEAGPPIQSPPILIRDAVLFRRGQRSVIALRQSDGQLLWEHVLPDVAPVYPATATGMPGMPGADPYGMPGMPGTTGTASWRVGYEDLVRSGLIAHGDDAFAVGDDGALYGFSARAADNLPPEIKDPTLELEIQRSPLAFRMRAVPADSLIPPPGKDDVLQTPGAPPIWLHAEITDAGAGVNPASLQVLMDGNPVSSEQQVYEPGRALIWWVYDPKGVATANLPGGMRRISFRATDWAGNTGESVVYFFVDNSLSQPRLPGVPDYTTFPGMPGMPGMPGAPGAPWMPGGMPGAPPTPPMMY